MDAQYDIVVVGAGPGGYVAAIRAAQLGANVCLVERGAIGGTCLNRGCIPTKALAASAAACDMMRVASSYGIQSGPITPDFPAMIARAAAAVEKLTSGVQFLLRKHKITVRQGKAAFSGPNTLIIDGDDAGEITATNMIVATGSKPLVFPQFGYDGVHVITSDEVLKLQEVPTRLAIIGGGVIGCEYASIFNSLGAKVTIIEAMPAILPTLDKEVGRQLASYLKRRGIVINTGAKVTAVRHEQETLVEMEGAAPVACDLVMAAVGRRANSSGLRLDAAGVTVNAKGEVVVDAQMRTSSAHIYAIGDVTDTPWKLAHVASRQGIVAAHNIMGQPVEMDYTAVPAAIFTAPEVASVGLTTEAAQTAGIVCKTFKFPFLASGKAITAGHTEGFVKVVAAAEDERILGVHIIGAQASALIAEATLAVQQGLKAPELAAVIHAHPTLPEALMEAVEGLSGLAIHV